MRNASPGMRALAERLMAHEARGKRGRASIEPAAKRVCERLRPELSSLVGNTGVKALYLRALALAGAEVAWLRAVRVGADDKLEGFDGPEPVVEPDEVYAGGVALLTELLGLLAAFIGEPLTLQIVREKWPQLSLKNLDRNTRN